MPIVVAFDIGEQVATRGIAIGVLAVVNELGFQSTEDIATLPTDHERSDLWAERFAGNAHDLFGLQDQITRQIAVALDLELVDSTGR